MLGHIGPEVHKIRRIILKQSVLPRNGCRWVRFIIQMICIIYTLIGIFKIP